MEKLKSGESYQRNEVNVTIFAEKAPNLPFMEYDFTKFAARRSNSQSWPESNAHINRSSRQEVPNLTVKTEAEFGHVAQTIRETYKTMSPRRPMIREVSPRTWATGTKRQSLR